MHDLTDTYDSDNVPHYQNTFEAVYLGCIDAQVNFGGHDDPRPLLRVGSCYIVCNVEEHAWHTHYTLVEFPGKKFNSVCFRKHE